MNQLARDRNEKTLSKKFFVVLFFRVSFFLFWAIQRQRTFGTKLCSSANAFCFAQMQDSIPVYCIVHVLCMYYALGTCVYNWDDTAGRNLKEYRWTKLPSFLFGVLKFCRFWFKRFEKNGDYKQTEKKYFITKILIFTKMSKPIRETRVLKLVFITIPCLKFCALLYFAVKIRVFSGIFSLIRGCTTLLKKYWMGVSKNKSTYFILFQN